MGKTAPIRPQDRHRMDVVKQYSGCLPCLLLGHADIHTSIEHCTDRGRRMNGREQHQATIGLCGWHHFGVCWPHRTTQWMIENCGPSILTRVQFEDYFGTEEILIKVQDLIVTKFDERPWPAHNMPLDVALDARDLWIELNAR